MSHKQIFFLCAIQAVRLYSADESFDKERFLVLTSLLQPKSTGSITLRSTDPFDHPVIDANYLSHPDDISTLIKGNLVLSKP